MKQNIKNHLKKNLKSNQRDKKALNRRKKRVMKNLFDLEKLGFSDPND